MSNNYEGLIVYVSTSGEVRITSIEHNEGVLNFFEKFENEKTLGRTFSQLTGPPVHIDSIYDWIDGIEGSSHYSSSLFKISDYEGFNHLKWDINDFTRKLMEEHEQLQAVFSYSEIDGKPRFRWVSI